MESIDLAAHFLVKYRIRGVQDTPLESVAAQCALDGSTVSWSDLDYQTPSLLDSHSAKVVGFSQSGDFMAEMTIAFPLINFSLTHGGIPLLLATIAGSIFRERSVEHIRIADIIFPDSFVRQFQGPRYGIDGIRKRLGVHNRPIVIARIHDVGLRPSETAKICHAVALGGVDVIYTSPLLVDSEYSPMFERTRAVAQALDKARQQTGKEVLYFPNLTVDSSSIVEIAEQLVRCGAAGIETDMLSSGFSAIKLLRQNVDAMIIFYPITHSLFTRGRTQGIDFSVLLKLGRLAGADMACISSVAGRFEAVGEVELRILGSVLTGQWSNVKPTLPIVIGGQHPGTVGAIVNLFGHQIGISAGTGILGHPDGYEPGAKAMMQALDVAINRIARPHKKRHREYLRAIQRWGKV